LGPLLIPFLGVYAVRFEEGATELLPVATLRLFLALAGICALALVLRGVVGSMEDRVVQLVQRPAFEAFRSITVLYAVESLSNIALIFGLRLIPKK
jgi:hypothetical protein